MGYEKKYYLIKDYEHNNKICGQVLLETTSYIDFSARIAQGVGQVFVHVFYSGKEIGVYFFSKGVIAKRLFVDEFDATKIGWVFEVSECFFVAGAVPIDAVENIKNERIFEKTSEVYHQIAEQMFLGHKPCFFDSIQKLLDEFLKSAEKVHYFDKLFYRSELGIVETNECVHVVGKIFGVGDYSLVIGIGKADKGNKENPAEYEWKFFDAISGARLQNSRIFGHKNGNYYFK